MGVIMDPVFEQLRKDVDDSLVPGLMDFLRVPNQSRHFDPDWKTDGLLQKACESALKWFEGQNIQGANVHYIKDPEKPPVVVIEVAGPKPETVLFYGHFDKQPPLTDLWRQGLGPYTPVIEGDKLYGRGAADDGFAFFEVVTVLKFLQKQKKQRNRFVLVFEADEESGSKYLPSFLDENRALLGDIKLIVNMDSGSTSHDHFGYNNTLRGILRLSIEVAVLKNGVHSGQASGAVPDSFRIARHIIEELELMDDGSVVIDGLYKPLPGSAYDDIHELVRELGPDFQFNWPFLEGVQPVTKDLFKQVVNSTWLTTFTLTGVDGVPEIAHSGNVLRPFTRLLYSIRIPPHIPQKEAKEAIQKHVERLVKPYNAHIKLETLGAGNGFVAPPLPPKMQQQLDESAMKFFGKKVLKFGSGGSIPILSKFSAMFPNVPFLSTGCCLQDSNMHGPNENLSIAYTKKHICSFYDFLATFDI